jgi:integrase
VKGAGRFAIFWARVVGFALFQCQCSPALDTWLQAAGLISGRIFRAVNKGGRICGDGISGQAVFEIVTQYSAQSGLNNISPHHLRRTFARLAHNGKSSLEQVQLSLGHHQIATTTDYIGVQQDLNDAPCDHLGLGMRGPTS